MEVKQEDRIKTEDLEKLLNRHGMSVKDRDWLFVSRLKLILGFGLRANEPPLTHTEIRKALQDIHEDGKATLHLVEALQNISFHGQKNEEEKE